MISLKNFSENRYFLIGFLVAVFIPGCATAPVSTPGTALETRGTAPPLKIVSLSPDKASPQAATIISAPLPASQRCATSWRGGASRCMVRMMAGSAR
jgi:hypothetical protein